MLGNSGEAMMVTEPAVLLHQVSSNTETAAALFSNEEELHRQTSGDVDHEGGHDDDHRSYGGGGGGNRWPRQETLALLKIRSEMDAAFRDSSLKAPLWEDVSRKLGELGYQRSAKKCKEKFENVYKYHRRTKEGRSGKPEGKTYRFFDELEAFDHQQNSRHPSTIPPKPPVVLWTNNSNHHPNQSVPPVVTVPQNGVTPATDPIMHPSTNNSLLPQSSQDNTNGFRLLNPTTNLFSSSTSSTTASDEEFQQRNKRKRKWKYFFRRLTKQVLEKQERLQEKFLETIAKCDQEQMVKEEAWRVQEMARIDREHEVLVHERSTAAAKDAALIQFLQKVSLQHNSNDSTRSLEINDAAALLVPPTNVPRPLPALPVSWAMDHRGFTTSSDVAPRNLESKKVYSNGENNTALATVGSSRWPKTEVQALIDLRTTLDVKYQEAGPKGSLWEEISTGMRRLGYNRSSKRCKEKWENINKYFKKVKESSKTRPEDSKTCPYFHQLEALYKKKNNKIEYHHHKSCIEDRSTVEKLQIMQPLRENVDPNQEEDEHDHGEEGESTEEEQEHDQIGIVTSYKPSSMEMV